MSVACLPLSPLHSRAFSNLYSYGWGYPLPVLFVFDGDLLSSIMPALLARTNVCFVCRSSSADRGRDRSSRKDRHSSRGDRDDRDRRSSRRSRSREKERDSGRYFLFLGGACECTSILSLYLFIQVFNHGATPVVNIRFFLTALVIVLDLLNLTVASYG